MVQMAVIILPDADVRICGFASQLDLLSPLRFWTGLLICLLIPVPEGARK